MGEEMSTEKAVNDMVDIFGTDFEVSLRLPLLIHNHAMSEDRICAIDFITTYAKDFGIEHQNINGDSYFRRCEYASRQMIVKEAIRKLVLKGLLSVRLGENGFLFSLSEAGYDFTDHFKSAYAAKYYRLAQNVCKRYQSTTDDNLISMIYLNGGRHE